MKMNGNPTPYSNKKGCLHALLLILVSFVLYAGAGVLFSRDPYAVGHLWGASVLVIGFIGLFVSYLMQKRHFWVAGIIALLACGTVPALFFYFWYDSRVRADEQQLSIGDERIVNSAFGFSFSNPGKDFVLASELPEEARKQFATQPGLFAWFLESQTLPESVRIVVFKSQCAEEEECFRSFVNGIKESPRQLSSQSIEDEVLIWEPARREFHLSGMMIEDEQFLGIRCLPSAAGAEQPFIVCAFTIGETVSALDFVREGLAIGDGAKVFPPASPTSKNWKESLDEASSYLRAGDFENAIRSGQQALDKVRHDKGENHADVGTSLNNLGETYWEAGQYAKAEPLLLQALQIAEKTEPETASLATILNNLGLLYVSKGLLDEGEKFHQRALAIREKILPPDDTDIAQSLDNISDLYRRQGKCKEALTFNQQALAIYEKALGHESRDVAISLGNLSWSYQCLNELKKAGEYRQEALDIQEEVLGDDHPEVATSLNNLASIYWEQHNYAQAEPLAKRALAMDEKISGQASLSVAYDLNTLACIYRDQGQYGKAEPLYKRALSIWETELGAEHPNVILLLNNLAETYRAMRRTREAEELEQRISRISVHTSSPGASP